MPSLDLAFLKSLQCDYKSFPNFVETGTYFGETIFAMEPHFTNLYTIEVKEEFYTNTKTKYTGSKIQFYLGDSAEVLCTLVPTLSGKTIFFLDGHWSAGRTGRGKKDCPLLEELDHIVQFHKDQAIVIIDDARLFGKGPSRGTEICNWEAITTQTILQKVESRMTRFYTLPSSHHPHDRFILHLTASQ
jgi:hypothetical protein